MDGNEPHWRRRALEQFEAELDRIGQEFDEERRSLERSARDEARDGARDEVAEMLNRGLRRLRQTAGVEDTAVMVLELSAPFATRCAVFLFKDGRGVAKGARGLGPLPLEFAPDSGEAFRVAIATRDPVIAMATEGEVTDEVARRIGTGEQEKVFLFPVAARDEVRAIVLAAGTVAIAGMELIAGMAAMRMESLAAAASETSEAGAPQRADLISIAGAAANSSSPKRRESWADLPPELQGLHLRAQREGRLRVAEMRLEHGEALRRGLQNRNIYEALREPIDRARAKFRANYVAQSPSMVDYLYLELVRNLAGGDDLLLGPDFPGPLV